MITAKPVGNDHTNGTFNQGRIQCSYQTLVELFGEPENYDDYKSDAGWCVLFTNTETHESVIATIYNWKNGKNYCGESGTPTKQITDWNIGGLSKRAIELVQQFIDGR